MASSFTPDSMHFPACCEFAANLCATSPPAKPTALMLSWRLFCDLVIAIVLFILMPTYAVSAFAFPSIVFTVVTCRGAWWLYRVWGDVQRVIAQANGGAQLPPLFDLFAAEDVVDDACTKTMPSPKHWPPPLSFDDDALARLSLPAEFCCPISHGLMRLPMITPMGTTYDCEFLVRWVNERGRYPANEQTGALSTAELVPNLVLRNMIERWLVDFGAGAAVHA